MQRENVVKLEQCDAGSAVRYSAFDHVELSLDAPPWVTKDELLQDAFFRDDCQATKELELRLGAQVMLLRNEMNAADDPTIRTPGVGRLVNGSRGVIIGFDYACPLRTDERLGAHQTAVAAAETAGPRSRDEIARRTAAAADFRRKLAELGTEVAKNEQGVGPLTTERDDLTKSRSAQLKEYARLQARPALVEKELEAKSTPLRERLKVAQEALKPLEAPLAEVRTRLAAALKPIEAKRAEVAAATTKLAAARQAAAAAEKSHAALVREIPERARNLEELARSLAELQPQVEPLKAKVKASEARYLAMLPKK